MAAFSYSVLITGTLWAAVAWPQVNLIVGAPNTHSPMQYAASVAEVLADGSVNLGESLADPANGGGFFWFDIDYDFRQAYALDDHDGAVVLDLNTGRVVKRCQIPPIKGLGGVFEWRIVDPLQGPAFALLRGNSKPDSSVLSGMLADPSLACADSMLMFRNGQIAGYATGGNGGVGGEAAQTQLFGNLDRGRFRRKGGPDWIYFPIELTAEIMKDFSSTSFPSAAIPVRNQSIEVLVASSRKPQFWGIWAHERPSGDWIRLPIPAGHSPNIRGFGTFIAWPESILEDAPDTAGKTGARSASERSQSTGADEWRKTDSKFGRSTDFALTHSSTIHPGILHIFDVKTQRHFVLRTGQSDSEILLIEKNFVYYRSSDRLFRAEIRDDKLTEIRQIARSELVRDAHWAFISRKSAIVVPEVR